MKKQIILENRIDELVRLSAFIDALGEEWSIAPEVVFNLQLALEECATNVIMYAYPPEEKQTLLVTAELVEHDLMKQDPSKHDLMKQDPVEQDLMKQDPVEQGPVKHDLVLTIEDGGLPFDPTQVAEADTTLSAEERPIGGLGIFLVRQLMDTVAYQRVEGKNRLTLMKRIN